jgi:replication-associated recombination protein RarA
VELHEVLSTCNGVVLYGSAGCGKTTIIRVLAAAWTLLSLELQWGKIQSMERIVRAKEALKEEEVISNMKNNLKQSSVKELGTLDDLEDYENNSEDEFYTVCSLLLLYVCFYI